MADHQRGIQTVELAGEILKLLSSSYKPLSLSEIAEQMNMVPSSVYKYLVSMVRIGLLKRDESTLEFEAGALCLRLGLSHLNHNQLLKNARIALTQFAEQDQINVFVSMWSNTCGPTVVFYKEFAGFYNIGFRLGITLSLIHTATGRLFSAFQDQEILAKFNNHQKEKQALNTLQDACELIRAQGYSVLIDTPTPNLSSYAIPVFDQQNNLILAITAFSETKQLDQVKINHIINTLKGIAQNLRRDQ